VVAPVRLPVPERSKLQAPVIDYESLPEDADWWGADAVICAIGTTMKAAPSQDAFRCIDHWHQCRRSMSLSTPRAVSYLNESRGILESVDF
jgi:hypothetical protein